LDRKCFVGNKTEISREIINKQLVSISVRPSTSDVYFLEGSEYFVQFSSSALSRQDKQRASLVIMFQSRE